MTSMEDTSRSADSGKGRIEEVARRTPRRGGRRRHDNNRSTTTNARVPPLLVVPEQRFSFGNSSDFYRFIRLSSPSTQPLKPNKIHSHVAIAGIVRDGMPSLPRMIGLIEDVGRLFTEHSILIIENDSTDGTCDILESWAQFNPRVQVDSRKLGARNKRPSHSFLADMRNRYIELLRLEDATRPSFDLLVVLDMDLFDIDIVGVQKSVSAWLRGPPKHGTKRSSLQSFQIPKSWAAIASNGVAQDGRYYDVFALRSESTVWPSTNGVMFRKPEGQALIKTNTVVYDPIRHKPFSVDSAFGGLAIYRASSVLGCKYDAGPNRDCEHVLFHACIAKKNRGGMGVVPRMLVVYDIGCHFCTGNSTEEAQLFSEKRLAFVGLSSQEQTEVLSVDDGIH